MGNCRSRPPAAAAAAAAQDDDVPDNDEAALLAGTLLSELGIRSLLRRPDGRQLRTLWRSFAEDVADADTAAARASNGDGAEPTLSRRRCGEFLRAASVRWGDGSWQQPRQQPDGLPQGLRSVSDEGKGGVRSGPSADVSSAPDARGAPCDDNAGDDAIGERPSFEEELRSFARRRRRRSAMVMANVSRALFSRRRGSAPPPDGVASVSARLLRDDRVSWEAVRSKLWDEPVVARGVSSTTVLAMQVLYLRKLGEASRNGTAASDRAGRDEAAAARSGTGVAERLTREQAADLALEALGGIETVPRRAKERAVKSLGGGGSATGSGGSRSSKDESYVSFLSFVRRIGPTYERYSASDHDVGLRDKATRGDLPVDVSTSGGKKGGGIRSFAPPRDGTPVEILNCGQAVFTAMLNAVKGAKSEICMSWWEFCPTVPAVRGPDLGNAAWKDEGSASGEERTLPPILRRKAEGGVKVYIMLNDVTVNWTLVDYAVRSLGGAHRNIHVMRHPDFRVSAHTHHQKFVVVDRAIAVLGGVDWTVARWDLPSHPIFDEDASVHPGLELPVNGKRSKHGISDYWTQPHLDLTDDRNEQECALWQDVAVCVRGDAANDVAVNFVQRWEHARGQVRIDERGITTTKAVLPAIPAESDLDVSRRALDIDTTSSPYPLAVGGFPSPGTLKSCRCQIVRSIGDWSAGLKTAETSHYEAWISAINDAEQYIYIEQQYFVCNMGVGEAKNRVAEAILRRVERAVELSKPFRIYVVIPATVYMTVVNYFTRRTLLQDGRGMNRREKSLMTRIQMLLKKAAPGSYWDGRNADSMLSVCTLSSVGTNTNDRWEVGEIFVHSKVLIVDDRVSVIGSANVNDRSFRGTSDSEIGAILWDEAQSSDGATGCIKDFRLRLFRQYLGLSPDGSEDGPIASPASEEAFALWCKTALENQQLISSVFDHFPSDSITHYGKYTQLQNAYKAKNPSERAASLRDPERLNNIKGLLTKYPPKFLGNERKRTFLHMLMGELPMPAYL